MCFAVVPQIVAAPSAVSRDRDSSAVEQRPLAGRWTGASPEATVTVPNCISGRCLLLQRHPACPD